MNTANILEVAIELRDSLKAQGSNEVLFLERQFLKNMIEGASLQKDYYAMKLQNNDLHIDFLEGGTPMTFIEIKTLKEAITVNKQIGKLLRDSKT